MTAPISSLANMEMALYGGFGPNSAAPSYVNGYRGEYLDNLYNPYSLYNNYPNNFNPYQQAQAQAAQQNNSVLPAVQSNANQADLDTLANYYKENNVAHEGFGGALFGGLTFAAMENPQSLAHPINAFKAASQSDKIFKSVLDSAPKAKELWKTNPSVMQDAYSQLMRVNRNAQSKWFYSKWFVSPMAETERAGLEKIMTEALKTGDPKKIQIATEQLRAASKCNGRLPQAWNWVKSQATGKPVVTKTPTQLAAEAVSSGAVEKTLAEKGLSFAKRGLKEGKGWFFFDLILSSGKIFKAFTHEDGGLETGLKQATQSTVKAAGNALGWVAGKAAGAWAGAKLGALIGSAFPGVGTAVGAVVGFIGGSIGMWAMGKLTEKIAGNDVANELEAKDMKKTQEGQAQLLSFVSQKAQEGEKISPQVMEAAQRVALQYA